MGKAHDQLKLIRETLGLSQAEMAEAIGVKRASSYAYYEDPKGYKGSWLADRVVQLILEAAERGKFGDKRDQVNQLLGPALFKFRDLVPAPNEESSVLFTDAPWPGFSLIAVYFLQYDYQVRSFLSDGSPDDWTIMRDDQLTQASAASTPEELYVLRISSPGQFPPFRIGDEFLIDKTIDKMDRDGIYLIVDSDDRMNIRRMTFDHSTGEVLATHPGTEVAPIRYARPENLRIIGRVIWQSRSLFWTPTTLSRNTMYPPPKPVADYTEKRLFQKKAPAERTK